MRISIFYSAVPIFRLVQATGFGMNRTQQLDTLVQSILMMFWKSWWEFPFFYCAVPIFRLVHATEFGMTRSQQPQTLVQSILMMLWNSWCEFPFFTLQCQYFDRCALLDSRWIDLSSLIPWFNPFQWCYERVDENFHFLLCSANISTGAGYWIRDE